MRRNAPIGTRLSGTVTAWVPALVLLAGGTARAEGSALDDRVRAFQAAAAKLAHYQADTVATRSAGKRVR